MLVVSQEEFVTLKKFLQQDEGQLLIDVLRRGSAPAKPQPGHDISQAGVLGVLLGTSLGFNEVIEHLEDLRNKDPQKPESDQLDSTYEDKH